MLFRKTDIRLKLLKYNFFSLHVWEFNYVKVAQNCDVIFAQKSYFNLTCVTCYFENEKLLWLSQMGINRH